MSSWLSRDVYSPLLVFAAGLLTFVGAVGVGRTLLNTMGVRLAAHWHVVTGALLGLLVTSLAVQVAAMFSVATPRVLIAIVLVVWVCGAVAVARSATFAHWGAWRAGPASGLWWGAAGIVAAALAVNLVVALAPSTKQDELYYHMLVPGRVIYDHGLRFYLLPWQAAVLPHMVFQLAVAPLHAMQLPDAPNVLSWALSCTMIWFAYRLIRESLQSAGWAMGWCAAILVGLFATVWYGTGGSHAMNDLSSAALVLAVILPADATRATSLRGRALMLGILAAATITAKISSAPMALALLAFGVAPLTRGAAPRDAAGTWGAALLPLVVAITPLVAWAWHGSGAPLGSAFASWFPGSRYTGLDVAGVEFWGAIPLQDFVARQSPLLWAGAAAAIVVSALPRAHRGVVGAIFGGQVILVIIIQGLEPRYLGGFPCALAIAFACAPAARSLSWVRDNRRSAVMLLVATTVPWLALQTYYARPFAEVVFGIRTPDAFRRAYVNFYTEYEKLDAVLPQDAILLTDLPISSTYAPRLPVWTTRDLPVGHPVYQMAESCDMIDRALVGADTVFRTDSATATVYRTPGRLPEYGPLCVRRVTLGREAAR